MHTYVGERQIYHEKCDQRRKLRWMRLHRMQDSSLKSFARSAPSICRTWVTKGTKVQLAHPKVAQPSLLLVSSTHPARMPDGPAKRPGACRVFVAASHQTRLDTRSKARRPIKVGIKGREGRERAETRTLLVSAAHWLT